MDKMRNNMTIAVLLALSTLLTIRSDAKVVLGQNVHAAVEGTSSRVNCSVTGETFEGWFTSDGRKLPTDKSKRVHVEGQGSYYDLVISYVNRTDKGRYECRGSAGKASLAVDVHYKPTVKLSESTTDVIYSRRDGPKEVELKCAFDGHPVPTVTIKRPDKKKVAIRQGSASYQFYTREYGDYGFYECEGKNDAGTGNHDMEVYEAGAPEPPSGVELRPNCDRVDVTWEPPLNDKGSDVTGYSIELRRKDELVGSDSFGISTRSKRFDKLEKSSGYVVRMNAKNSMGTGAWRTIPFNTTQICSSAQTVTAGMLALVSLVTLSVMVMLC